MSESVKHYPRVLIVGGPPFGTSRAGVMVTNLFQGWPIERLAQVHGLEQPDSDVCQRYWQVGPADVPIDRVVRRLIGGRREQLVGRPSAGIPPGLGKAASGGKLRIRVTVHGIASSWADVFPLRLSGAFWDWVTDFRPDVIYSMLASIRIMNLVVSLADRLQKLVVPHFMDDWPSTHYRATPLSLIPRWIMLRRIRAVLRRAPIGMAISEAMAQEYQQRYGIPFEALMNCVDTPGQWPEAPSRDNNEPLRFVYVGGLHLNRWRSIQEVGKALSALGSDGLRGEVVVYAPASDIALYGRVLAASPAVRIGGSLTPEEVMSVLHAADVLLHVEAFDDTVRAYTRLSLSTKIPQYMSSGRPILAYGPGELASCRYIADCDCGRVVGSVDPLALAHALSELASDPRLRSALGRRGWEVACQRHNAETERERFRRVLSDAATGDAKTRR